MLGALLRAMPDHVRPAAARRGNDTKAPRLLMILVMAAGPVRDRELSIREFIKERDIYERERMAGLSASAYLFSKVLVLGVISLVQALLIVIVGPGRAEDARQAAC